MTDAHHTRAHAQWSASATAANIQCPGRLALCTLAGPDKESEAAAWGTACHQIAETCLSHDQNADEHLGAVVETEHFEFVFDEEMASCTQEYFDYCCGRETKYNMEIGNDAACVWVEQHFSFDDLDPPFEAGGTGDCILYFPKWKMLEIVDLKTGKGYVVEVKGNAQERSYALGAMLKFRHLDVEIVRYTIVQPRAPHPDGRIRYEEIHIADLVEWTGELRAAMNMSFVALQEFNAIAAGRTSLAFETWAATWLKPGKCEFCPAAGFCPALKKQALETAGVWFDDLDRMQIGNTLPIESLEELAKRLNGLEMLEDYIKATRAYAHTRAENGETIPGWMLVDKIGNRAWLGDESKIAAELMSRFNLERDAVYARKLNSPAQIEKALGKRKSALAEMEGVLWEKPIRGTNLVAADKTERPPAKSKSEAHFEKLEN